MSLKSNIILLVVCLVIANAWTVSGKAPYKRLTPELKRAPSIINTNAFKTPPSIVQIYATMKPAIANTTDGNKPAFVTDGKGNSTLKPPIGNTTDDMFPPFVTNKPVNSTKMPPLVNSTDEIKPPYVTYQNGNFTMRPSMRNTTDEIAPPFVTDKNGNFTMQPPMGSTTDEIKPPFVTYQNDNFTTMSPMGNTKYENTPPSVTDNSTLNFNETTNNSSMTTQTTLNMTQPTTAIPSTSSPKTCDEPLGLSDGFITDAMILTSSSAAGQEKGKVRLNCCTDELGASWCPDDNDVYPWIEIRLPFPMFVSAILFQHPSLGKMSVRPSNYVKSVTLNYVPAGAVMDDHFVTFHKGMLALNATTAFKIKLNIYTQKIRIHPDTWHGLACFRAELYGCYLKNYGKALATVVHCSKDGTEDLQCVPEHHDVNVTSGNAANLVNQCHEPLLYLYENSCAQLPMTLTCFKDPDSCPEGFTISLNVKLDTEAPRYLFSTSREHRNHTGVSLFYQNDILMAAVQLEKTTWLVSTLHTLTAGAWHWIEISWTRTHGLQLYAEGKLIASSPVPSPTETSRIHSDHMTIGCSDDIRYTYGGMWMKKLLMAPISREQLVQSSPYFHNARGLPDNQCGVMTPPTLPTTTHISTTTAEQTTYLYSEQTTEAPPTEQYGTPTDTNTTTLSTDRPPTEQQGTPTESASTETTASTTVAKTPAPTPSAGPECSDPMWWNYFTVSDVTTSSNGHNTSAASSVTNCCIGPKRGGWCPDPATLNSSSPAFIEVTFKRPIGIQSIEIQPPEINSPTIHVTKYMTSYYVQYEPLNGHNLITLSTLNGPVLLRGVDVNGFSVVSSITTIPGIVTRRLRLIIAGYHREPCFRFQLFGCKREILCPSGCENGGMCVAENICKCPVPFFGNRCEKNHIVPGRCRKSLGMSDGSIRDDQLKVSSQDGEKSKEKARYGCCAGEHNGAWCPHPNDTSPYYEVSFPNEKLIAEIMFDFPSRQHLFDEHDTYMKTFSIFYYSHGHLHLYAPNLQAIYNSTVTFTDDFDPYIKTNVIRIVPETWEKAACFRFELIGCDAQELPVIGRRRRRELRPRVNRKINN